MKPVECLSELKALYLVILTILGKSHWHINVNLIVLLEIGVQKSTGNITLH